jgi:hypothetical protein
MSVFSVFGWVTRLLVDFFFVFVKSITFNISISHDGLGYRVQLISILGEKKRQTIILTEQ